MHGIPAALPATAPQEQLRGFRFGEGFLAVSAGHAPPLPVALLTRGRKHIYTSVATFIFNYFPLFILPRLCVLFATGDVRGAHKMLTHDEKLYALQLLSHITHVFHKAFCQHRLGYSQEDITLEHDIDAAYNLLDESVLVVSRNAIKAACQAVDDGIPYFIASSYLATQVAQAIEQHFEEQHAKQAL
jgi:hypothetical protein